MDSSKQENGKEKKSGNKRLRTNLHDSSSQVATSSASTDQGGSNEAQVLHSIPLNILKLDEIDLIADKLPIMDRLHFQQAFSRDPEKVVNNIQNGIAANLAKQRALYLLMDLGEYDVKYQYNYQIEGKLPNSLLPTLKGLPIASEAFNMITLPELEKISLGCLKRIFPNLVELKVVLREWSPAWLTKLAKVVKTFSPQLTGFQLLIFSELTTPWGINYLLRLISHLNDASFDRLRHFTLFFEDTEETRIPPLDMKTLRLLSSRTLEECYLQLPFEVLEPQLKLLKKNQGLQRLGIIASYCGRWDWQIGDIDRLREEILTNPSLFAKIVHLMFCNTIATVYF